MSIILYLSIKKALDLSGTNIMRWGNESREELFSRRKQKNITPG